MTPTNLTANEDGKSIANFLEDVLCLVNPLKQLVMLFFLGGCAVRKHEAASWWQISCFPMGPLLYLGCGKNWQCFLATIYNGDIYIFNLIVYLWLFLTLLKCIVFSLFTVDPQCT